MSNSGTASRGNGDGRRSEHRSSVEGGKYEGLEHRTTSRRQVPKEEGAPEMREREYSGHHNDYNRGDMRYGGSVSMGHQNNAPSGAREQLRNPNLHPERHDHRRKDSSASRNSRDRHDRGDRERDDKDKPLPDPKAQRDSRPLPRASGEDGEDRRQNNSSRPQSESKGYPALSQKALVTKEENREAPKQEHDRPRQHREPAEPQPTSTEHHSPSDHEMNEDQPSALSHEVLQEEGTIVDRPSSDQAMRVEDPSDTEMESDYAEARGIQEQEEQTKRDRALALTLHQEETNVQAGRDSSSDSDFSSDTAQPPEPQGITRMIYSMVGGVSAPVTKEDKLKTELKALKKEYKKLSDAYNAACQHGKKMERDVKHWYDEGYRVHVELNALGKAHRDTQDTLRSLAAELAHTKQQLSDAVNLSEVRGKELKGAQVFLTKADTLSVNDVVQKVAALNEEIFQAAALLAEMLVYQAAEGSLDDHSQHRQTVIGETKGKAYNYLGSWLVDILATESMKPQDGPVNPLLAQIAFLIAITQWCASVCRHWIPEDPTKSTTLEDLYRNIRTAEDQAVAGRWRSLARAHLTISTAGWTGDLMRGINYIMMLAGWTTLNDGDLSQFEKRLTSILKVVRDVRKATGEDVTSADLEIYVIRRGGHYDPGQMEDTYGDDRAGASVHGAERERVAGPSGLGLRKVTMVKIEETYEQRQEILSLPKVALETTVLEATAPPPPPKPRRKDRGEPGTGGMLNTIGPSLT